MNGRENDTGMRALCPAFGRCGACSLLDVEYSEQLVSKQHEVEETYAGLVSPAAIRPILGMADPYHYRNKVISPFVPAPKHLRTHPYHYRNKVISPFVPASKRSKEQNPKSAAQNQKRTDKPGMPMASDTYSHRPTVCTGANDTPMAVQNQRHTRGRKPNPAAQKRAETHAQVLTGMYVKGTHRVVATDGCLVENAQANAIVRAVRDLMVARHIEPYNEDTGAGFLRHVQIRVGHHSGEVLVTLVTNGREFPASRSFCRELVKRCPSITTVVQNVNTRSTNVILGDEEHTLYGPGFILDTLCGLSFRLSSHSFYQVNAEQTEVLYRAAVDLANLSGDELVIDAYCGTGTIGLVAAQRLQELNALSEISDAKITGPTVIGVDSQASSIRDAKQNARHNGITNARFTVADAGEFLHDLANNSHGLLRENRRTVLFMDPPRAGASEEFLQAVGAFSPDTIVYISCAMQTQARDIRLLQKFGYHVETLQPVDMFPHTPHIETVALLNK